MWTVISEMGPDGPEHIVASEAGERKWKFDSKERAGEMADELNGEEAG